MKHFRLNRVAFFFAGMYLRAVREHQFRRVSSPSSVDERSNVRGSSGDKKQAEKINSVRTSDTRFLGESFPRIGQIAANNVRTVVFRFLQVLMSTKLVCDYI